MCLDVRAIAHRAVLAVATLLILTQEVAAYNVTISTAPTSNGTLTAHQFKATANDAVLNVSDLQAHLNADFTVKTGTLGSQPGDITVATNVTWSANTLTLDAHHSIVFPASLLPTATSGLTLTTNDGSGSGGDIIFSTGNIAFASTAQSLTINTSPYMLVDSVLTLQADISANASGDFALAHSETDSTFMGTPITPAFSGNFEGLGNTISNLTINGVTGPTGLALFNNITSTGVVRDFALASLDVEGVSGDRYVAGVASTNSGKISNVSITGQVVSTSTFVDATGGFTAGIVNTNTYTSPSSMGHITNCKSAATLSANSKQTVGGLVSSNAGTIDSSSATGSITVTGGPTVSSSGGGLVGSNSGTGAITWSFATGNLTVATAATGGGGLVGQSAGSVLFSYATGDVAFAGGVMGGLIGSNTGTVGVSYAAGDINGTTHSSNPDKLGGLIGYNNGPVANTYAQGSVIGLNTSIVGGLIGYADGTQLVDTSYSKGPVAGGSTIGGFIGYKATDGSPSYSYWDTTTSNQTSATGNLNNSCTDINGPIPCIQGLTTMQLKSGVPSGFDVLIWGEDAGVNSGFPYLRALPPS